MAGEAHMFADAFDAAFIIRHDLERLYLQHLPLVMLTDSKQIFDVITRASHTAEKRLMIDVAVAREAYNRYEISSVGLVKTEHNIANGLNKPGRCPALDTILRTGKDNNPVQQWVTRTGADTVAVGGFRGWEGRGPSAVENTPPGAPPKYPDPVQQGNDLSESQGDRIWSGAGFFPCGFPNPPPTCLNSLLWRDLSVWRIWGGHFGRWRLGWGGVY